MAEPFIGEIKMVAFQFAPKDWANCEGQQIPISQNPTLYSLLADAFGGNNTTYFNVPDYRGRTPISTGATIFNSTYVRGQVGGTERVTLAAAELPGHQHQLNATTAEGTTLNPTNGGNNNALLSTPDWGELYAAPTNLIALSQDTLSLTGGNQAHDKIQPSLGLRFVIALDGVYPPRN